MQLCWLHAVGERSRRMRHPMLDIGVGDPAGAFAREDGWFEVDCTETRDGVLAALEEQGRELSSETISGDLGKIHALVLLTPAFLYDPEEPCDILRRLSQEQGIVQRYFGHVVSFPGEDKRVQFLRVLRVLPLAAAVTPLTGESLGPVRSQFFSVPRVTLDRLLESNVDGSAPGGFAGMSVANAVQRIRTEHGLLMDGPPSIAMASPWPHTMLLACGKWTWYAMPAPRHSGSLAAYAKGSLVPALLQCGAPIPARRRERLEAAADVRVDGGRAGDDPINLRVVADCLRQALQGMVLSREQVAHYAKIVRWVDMAQRTPSDRKANTHVIGRTWQWRIVFLLRHVILSLETKQSADFLRVLRLALSAVVPALWSETFRNMLDTVPRPRRSTLDLHRLTLHVGFLLWRRGQVQSLHASEFAVDTIKYIVCDSSPQGKRDWLLAMCCRLSTRDAAEAYKACRRLWESQRAEQPRPSHAHMPGQDLEDIAFLQQVLRWQVLTPTVIGSGRASAGHKMKALIWAIMLESSWEHAAALLTAAHFTTDFGTEAKLAAFETFDLATFYPWAFARRERDADGLADRSSGSDGEDGEDNPFEFAWKDTVPSPAIEVDDGDFPRAADTGFDMDWASSVLPGPAMPPVAGDSPEAAPSAAAASSEAQRSPERREGSSPRQPSVVDTSHTLHVLGLQHVLSNATDCMGNAMGDWDVWLTSLRHVCHLLRRQFSKDRLKATCFKDEPASLQWPLFAGFSASVVANRWASISSAVCDLSPLETPLRFAWDLDKFTFNRTNNNEHENDPQSDWRLDIGKVDAAITSPYFWGYTYMVSVISQVINHAMFWLMGCPCHNTAQDYRDMFRGAASSGDTPRGLDEALACPMAGRRAAEVASGEFLQICDELWYMCTSRLRMDRRIRDLPVEDQTRLLADAALGKQVFMFYVHIKTAAFQQLPLRCLGLACLDLQVARHVAIMCLRLFDSSPPGVEHHPLAELVCGKLRADTLAFAGGGNPSDELFKVIVEARFHMINEACVEGLHSVTKRGLSIAPHFGPNHVALLHHMAPIRRVVEEGQGGLENLARFCDRARTAEGCVRELGIGNHPVLREITDPAGSTKPLSRSPHRKVVVSVIYHCDLESLFDALPMAPKPLATNPYMAVPVREALDEGSELDAYLMRPMRDHMQEVLTGERVLLVKVDDAGTMLPFMRSWGQSLGHGANVEGGEFEMCGSAGQTAPPDSLQGSSWLAVQVVHHRPATLHLSKHSSMYLDNTCIVVTQHRVLEREGILMFHLDPLDKERYILVMSALGRLDFESLQVADCVVALSADVDLNTLGLERDQEKAMSDAIGLLFEAEALPGGARFRVESGAQGLQTTLRDLAEHGLVQSAGADDSWQLTDNGLARVKQARHLSAPVPILTPRSDISRDAMTYWELWCALKSDGWTVSLTSRSDRFLRENMPPFDPDGGEHIFYINPAAPSLRKHYLLALLMGKSIVPHGLSDKSYKSLCSGKQTEAGGGGGRARKRKGREFIIMGSGLAAAEETADVPVAKRLRRGRARGAGLLGGRLGRRGRSRGRGRARLAEEPGAEPSPTGSAADEDAMLLEDAHAEESHESLGDVHSASEPVESDASDVAENQQQESFADVPADADYALDLEGALEELLRTDLASGELPAGIFDQPRDVVSAGSEEPGPVAVAPARSVSLAASVAPSQASPSVHVSSVAAEGDPSGSRGASPVLGFDGDVSLADMTRVLRRRVPEPAVESSPLPPPPPEAAAEAAAAASGVRVQGVRGGRTVSRYPRLEQLDAAETPEGRFHGIRCVRNPGLHGGKWDSMRAICAFHGQRCELSRALTESDRRPEQGRPLGLLWSWLEAASEFPDKDSHCSAGDRRYTADLQSLQARQAARHSACCTIAALPDDEERDFWERSERALRPGEPEEPEACP